MIGEGGKPLALGHFWSFVKDTTRTTLHNMSIGWIVVLIYELLMQCTYVGTLYGTLPSQLFFFPKSEISQKNIEEHGIVPGTIPYGITGSVAVHSNQNCLIEILHYRYRAGRVFCELSNICI